MAVSFCGKRLLLSKNLLFQSVRQSGYVVLVPEIGEEIPADKKSLLNEDGLPEFNNVTIEKCVSLINKQCVNFENGLQQIEEGCGSVKNVFSDIFKPMEHFEAPLDLTWGLAKTLYVGNNSLMPTKSYKAIHVRATEARFCKHSNKVIYEAIKKAKEADNNYTEEEKRLIDKYILEGKLNGLDLDQKKTSELSHIRYQLSKEVSQYTEKVKIATRVFSQTIEDVEVTKDFPETLLRSIAPDPNEPTRGPWKVTLYPSVYNKFMEYCPVKKLRFAVWLGLVQRCSQNAEESIRTSINLEILRSQRNDMAKVLGYENFVDMNMVTKMAGKIENVNNMIDNLLERARPIQDVEFESLTDFAKKSRFNSSLDHWDIPYWGRKQLKAVHNFDGEALREYFPLPYVLNGLFNLCMKLFDIRIVERPKTQTWHEDVKFFDVFDSDGSKPIAGFYFDPYARESDKVIVQIGTGSMISIRNRSTITGSIPLASLVFDFPVPIYGKPSLLSFDEVKVLFYQFGHCLRHLLTEANYSDVAGSSNVEWDAVRVCGYVMTHWLYESNILKSISSHYTTQEQLSNEAIEGIQKSREHMSAYKLCKELYLSSLDLKLHTSKAFWRDIVKDLWPKYHTLPMDSMDDHPCAIPEIITEGWAAGYYSNVWSKMIAADVYSAFYEARHDENDILEIGRRYKDTFLASGGTCHASEVFRRFRGRDPSHKALLQTLGLKKKNETEQKKKEH